MSPATPPADVYIVGDQTFPVFESLQRLRLVPDNAILKAFPGEAFSAIRREVSALPVTERDGFPQAENFGLFLEAIQRLYPCCP